MSRDNPDLQGAGSADSLFKSISLIFRSGVIWLVKAILEPVTTITRSIGSRNQDVLWDQLGGSGLHDTADGLKAKVDLYHFVQQTALVVVASVLKHAERCLLAADIVT